MFMLALPGRGQYPPDGMHRADADEFSMRDIGEAPFIGLPRNEWLGHPKRSVRQPRRADLDNLRSAAPHGQLIISRA